MQEKKDEQFNDDYAIAEEFEIQPIKKTDLSRYKYGDRRVINYWKYGFLILGAFVLIVLPVMISKRAAVEPTESKSFIGDVYSAAYTALWNIFDGEMKQEILVQVLDLNERADGEKDSEESLLLRNDAIDSINRNGVPKVELKESAPIYIEKTTLPQRSYATRIFISEVLFNPLGKDEGYEFIELYNNGDIDVDLESWSLKKADYSNGTQVSLVKIGSAKEDRTLIKAKGFLLIGFNNYLSSPAADITRRSAFLPNNPTTITFINNSGEIIDSSSYPQMEEGKSWERESYNFNSFKAQPRANPRNSE